MLPKVVYPPNDKRAKVGKRVIHKPTGYVFEKSKNGRWSFIWLGDTATHIGKLYASGEYTVRRIGIEMNLCPSTVQRFLETSQLLGAKRSLISRGKHIIKTEQKTIKTLYLDKGYSIRELAEHFNVALNLMHDYIKGQSYRRTLSESTMVALRNGRRDPAIFNVRAVPRHLKKKIDSFSLAQYREAVTGLTRVVMYKYGHLIDPDNKRSIDYHVDHMYSVSDGWSKLCKEKRMFVKRDKLIPLHLICHPANLQLLTNSQNIHKGRRSALTLKELKREVEKFERLHGAVFSG